MARPYGLPAVAALALLLLVGLGIPPASGAAVVAWPPSPDVLISEVQTGGASASDEFVELYNAAAAPVDLAGLEIAYVSSSGVTASRKASWSASLILEPGGHLLVANLLGTYAGIADATYSGGFAAAGGALVLRVTGGATIDALAWGDATNAFVEGTAATAPAAGQSLERRPGGAAGSGLDSNDNSVDFAVRDDPDPQGLAAAPIPGPGPSPSPDPSPTATVEPTATPSPTPTVEPTSSPGPTPTPTPEPTSSPSPTSTPTPEPTSSATPSPTPGLTPITIAEARLLADGQRARLGGVLTTSLGLVEAGHAAFVQDDSAGIGLYLATADWPALDAGTAVLVDGSITSRYGQVTLRLDRASDLTALGAASEPAPRIVASGAVDESTEGLLAQVDGLVTVGPDTLSDGFAVTVDDGSGPLRVVAATASGITPEALQRQVRYRLTGVIGQRDSSGTGAAGYRLYLRSPADLTRLAEPSPSPSPTPDPSSSPDPTPSPEPTPSPAPTVAPTASPTPGGRVSTVSQARSLPLGTAAVVRGVVTAEVGRVVDDKSLAVQDASGGIVVRLDGQGRNLTLRRGAWVEVRGVLGQRHDDLELKMPDGVAPTILGTAAVPAPLDIDAAGLGEAREGRLVRLTGLVAERTASSTGTLTVIIEDLTGRARIVFLPAAGARLAHVPRGARVTVTGVAGQYSSATGRPDGYRMWPRDLGDLLVLAAPAAGADSGTAPARKPGTKVGRDGSDGASGGSVGGGAGSAASSGPPDVALGDLEAHLGRLVRASGHVDALAADALILADASGQAQVLLGERLAGVAATLRIGDLVNVVGTVRRGPDDDPVIDPRGPGDVVQAAALGGQAGAAGGADPLAVGAEPTSAARALAADPRPSGLPTGQLALALALILAGGSALAVLLGGRGSEHLFWPPVLRRFVGGPRRDVPAVAPSPPDGSIPRLG